MPTAKWYQDLTPPANSVMASLTLVAHGQLISPALLV